MDVLRHCEREIVRALKATGSTQSQVTHADRFEIATDDVVVKVWTADAHERERGAVERERQVREAVERSWLTVEEGGDVDAAEVALVRLVLKLYGGR